MKFGNHTPVEQRARGGQSPAAIFTRGLQIGGTQWRFAFDNGYGASVINDGYGGEDGLYELAVLDDEGHITYQTPITNDVLGYQTEAEIADALDRIATLAPVDIAAEKIRRLNADISQKREEIAAIERSIAELEAQS